MTAEIITVVALAVSAIFSIGTVLLVIDTGRYRKQIRQSLEQIDRDLDIIERGIGN